MSKKPTLQERVAEQFRHFLIAHDLRQTKERFAILHAAYNLEGIFTIDDLKNLLDILHFPVSTSTLYNTTQLLVQANLLIRHPFSSTIAYFERIGDNKPRNYQICNNCHLITRIRSRELAEALDLYEPRKFAITHRIVYINGLCAKCQRQMERALKVYDMLQEK
jgi:Fur family ferric uptake transcriptional regulator